MVREEEAAEEVAEVAVEEEEAEVVEEEEVANELNRQPKPTNRILFYQILKSKLICLED